jgi:uncharacterized protein (DUF433 family)
MADDQLITLTESSVARAAHVSIRRARSWSELQLVQPSLVRELGPRSTVRLYDWDASFEFLIVSEFVQRGVPVPQIRGVLDRLRELGYSQPLRQVEFGIAGHELYYRLDDGGWEDGRAPGQGVFREVLDLEMIRARVREAARPNRAALAGKIERRRGRMHSRQVFAGTRVPVDTIVRYVEDGFDDHRILTSFPDLLPPDVETARALAAV